MIGLIGPDGAGKSTLLGLIAGARRLQTGTLRVLEGDMTDRRHRRDVCWRIAYMPQGLGKNLYQDISVAENLAFFADMFGVRGPERSARIRHLSDATGLTPFLDRPVEKLSGGMKQKLGLCCALIHEPDLLILDEPTTGVDPLSRKQFWTLIAGLRQERPTMSIITSTAYMDEATNCDWLVVMDAGKVLATGTVEQLQQRTGCQDLESVFVALQPASEGSRQPLVIPPMKSLSAEPVIEAHNLTRRFGAFTAVDDVSFRIAKGEIFGFLGSNGSGKTTTMKMLTGLLAPSEGTAKLCGEPINASDLSMRRRVGFMTQSFSLFGELTVRQNLRLHGRLFHLGEKALSARIEALILEIGLSKYADSEAASLPLGLRQRLSLAVAIIHDPEILILDEPTSGVDPQARDDFWRVLVDLSRNQGVTVFVSTHFMNEAMRCDRISLMHAGKVLVCDTPGAVIMSKNAASLEDAFVAYITEATEPSAAVASDDGSLVYSGRDPDRGGVFSGLRRTLAYSLCESRSLIRDPIRLTFAFLGSFLLLLMFGFGLSTDVSNLSYAALDEDQTPESRAYLANFSSSPYFTEQAALADIGDMEHKLKSNDITLGLEIPKGFGRAVKLGGDWQVSAWVDGTNTSRAETAAGYVNSAHALFVDQRNREQGVSSTNASNTILLRNRYNPTAESIYSIGPSVPALLLILFLTILMAVSVSREKEIGTIVNFATTPTTRFEFLIGKQLPYIVVGMCNFVVMQITVVYIFDVPLKGSGAALTLGALLYVAASTGYGAFISTFTKSQVAAVFVGAILSMMPTVQFSGMMQPVSTLEGGARIFGNIWPTTYYMRISVGAFNKGLTFWDVASDLGILMLFPPVFLVLSASLLRKQEK